MSGLSRSWVLSSEVNARATLSVVTLLLTLLGATPAAALPYLAREVRGGLGGHLHVQSDAAQDACEDALKTEKASVKVDYIESGRENGRSYCETTGLSSCLASCN